MQPKFDIIDIGNEDPVTRIRSFRGRLGMSRREFGEKMGVKGNTWGNIEQRVNPFSDRYINLVCLTYHIRKEWLLNGEGSVYEEIQMSEPLEEKALPHDVEEFVEEFTELVEQNRKAVIDYMHTILTAQRNTMAATQARQEASVQN